MYKTIVFTLFAFCLSTTVNANDLGTRIESVKRLLTVSSAAKKIESSQSELARAMLSQARALREQADAAFKAGDEVTAKKLLSDATTKLFTAARMADEGHATDGKKKADYENRKNSIEALLKQYRSVAEEKHVGVESENVIADVLIEVAHAETLAKDGQYKDGRASLDKAYQQIKAALVKLRNGEELINALVFETPKDEYDYYVTKITSQRKAIGIFSERIDSPGKKKTIDRILAGADTDQAKAKTFVDAGNYEGALPHMDKALNKLRSGLMMIVN